MMIMIIRIPNCRRNFLKNNAVECYEIVGSSRFHFFQIRMSTDALKKYFFTREKYSGNYWEQISSKRK